MPFSLVCQPLEVCQIWGTVALQASSVCLNPCHLHHRRMFALLDLAVVQGERYYFRQWAASAKLEVRVDGDVIEVGMSATRDFQSRYGKPHCELVKPTSIALSIKLLDHST